MTRQGPDDRLPRPGRSIFLRQPPQSRLGVAVLFAEFGSESPVVSFDEAAQATLANDGRSGLRGMRRTRLWPHGRRYSQNMAILPEILVMYDCSCASRHSVTPVMLSDFLHCPRTREYAKSNNLREVEQS